MPALVSDQMRATTFLLFGVVVAALLAGTLVLWAYFGTTVFFEMVRAGWAACF